MSGKQKHAFSQGCIQYCILDMKYEFILRSSNCSFSKLQAGTSFTSMFLHKVLLCLFCQHFRTDRFCFMQQTKSQAADTTVTAEFRAGNTGLQTLHPDESSAHVLGRFVHLNERKAYVYVSKARGPCR